MNKILASIIYYFVRLLNATYRYRFTGLENRQKAIDDSPNNSYIYGIWHQNLTGGMLSQFHTKDKHSGIVSASKDGDLATYTFEKLGNVAARGSSTRGGEAALLDMIRLVKSGIPGAITVDGPKGPAHFVKKGIVEIARQTGSPILPFIAIPQNYWCFEKSWDKFKLPKPFSKIYIHYGKPIFVDEKEGQDNFQKYCELLKNTLETEESRLIKQHNA